jgi:hypothetical protein
MELFSKGPMFDVFSTAAAVQGWVCYQRFPQKKVYTHAVRSGPQMLGRWPIVLNFKE